MTSIFRLMDQAVDYAGLFPPAGLDMLTSVRNYRTYRDSDDAWALGRLVVPASRLDEFGSAVADVGTGSSDEEPWLLSVLLTEDVPGGVETVERANDRLTGVLIDSVEIKANDPDFIERTKEVVPSSLAVFFEIPPVANTELLGAIANTGAMAKVRTGGTREELFPAIAEVAGFIDACAAAGIAFKATAGLHHPIRGIHRLTYAVDSPSGRMHGFLNVFLAAAFRHHGMHAGDVASVLDEESVDAFGFAAGGVEWRSHSLSNEQLLDARKHAMISFGSCSFEEPVDELKGYSLL